MIRIIGIVLVLLMSKFAYGGDLVEGATITKIGSTNWNERVFYVILSGGTGICANKAVNFPEDFSQSTVAYAQAQSLAVTAFIHNKKVRIHNYGDKIYKNGDVCTGASFIELSN